MTVLLYFSSLLTLILSLKQKAFPDTEKDSDRAAADVGKLMDKNERSMHICFLRPNEEHCQTNIFIRSLKMFPELPYTLSPSSSAIRRISKRSTIFPECSNTSASASVTKSLYQSGAGLLGLEEDAALPIKKLKQC